jgi:ribonucleotide monophosphatase NagD (HAD superfamily)
MVAMDLAVDQASLESQPDRLFAGYIFDLDGAVYLSEVLLSGAEQLVAALRLLNRKILFLSNSPTTSPDGTLPS